MMSSPSDSSTPQLRCLNWGSSSSSNRRRQHATQLGCGDSRPWMGGDESSAPGRHGDDHHHHHQQQQQQQQQDKQQACREALRVVLEAALPAGHKASSHFVLTAPAVAAVVRQRLQDAAAAAVGGKAQAAAAAASIQQAQHDAEAQQRKQRELEQAAAQATAATAQHAQEVSALQAQLASLQCQHKQLIGKCGQQGRKISMLRQAAEAAEAGSAREQALHEQLQALRRSAAELSVVRQREAACRQAERQQAQSAAETAASQHQLELRRLRRAHGAELAALRRECEAQQQAQEDERQRVQAALAALFSDVGGALEDLRTHAAVQALSADDAAACQATAVSVFGKWMGKQVQQMRTELAAVRDETAKLAAIAAGNKQELCSLHQQLAQHAPDGVAVLAAVAAAAGADHAAVQTQLDAASEHLKHQASALQELQQVRAQLSNALGSAETQLAEVRAAEERARLHAEQLATHQASTQQQLQVALCSLEAHQRAAAAQAEQAAEEQEQLERQHQARMSDLQQQLQRAHKEANVAQQRAAWLHDTYLHLSLDAPAGMMAGGDDAGHGTDATTTTACTNAKTTRGQELLQMCSRLFGAPGGLEHLMQSFQQHKDEQQALGCAAAAPLLQLEAGLLQLMLRVHEATACARHPHSPPSSAAAAPLERNSSADSSSGSTDAVSCRSLGLPSCGSSSSSSSSASGAGSGMSSQLLLALQRDRMALAAQVKQLRGARATPPPDAVASQSPWRSAAASELDELVLLLKGSGFQAQQQAPALAAPAPPAAPTGAAARLVPPAGAGRRPMVVSAMPGPLSGQLAPSTTASSSSLSPVTKAKPATRALSWGARSQQMSPQQPDVDAVLRKCESVLAGSGHHHTSKGPLPLRHKTPGLPARKLSG